MTIDWKDRSTWSVSIDDALRRVLGGQYVAVVRRHAERIRYRDDEDDACQLFRTTATRRTIVAQARKALQSRANGIMAYHGCRTDDVTSYTKDGIRVLDVAAAQCEFRALFGPIGAGYSDSEIEAAIAAVPVDTREGAVYLALDDRFLTERCGQYLIYGSEYINCLAVHIPTGGEHSRDILKIKGQASIIMAKVPLDWIPSDDWDHLAERMLADHFYSIAHACSDVGHLDFSLIRSSPVAAKMICGHHRPVRIPDPYKQRRIWCDDKSCYEE